MIQFRLRANHLLVGLLCGLASVVLWPFAYGLRALLLFLQGPDPWNWNLSSEALWIGAVLISLASLVNLLIDLGADDLARAVQSRRLAALQRSARWVLVHLLVFTTYVAASKNPLFSRYALALHLTLLFGAVFGIQLHAPRWLGQLLFSTRHRAGAVLFSDSQLQRSFLDGWRRIAEATGLQLVHVCLNADRRGPGAAFDEQELEATLRAASASLLILHVTQAPLALVTRIRSICDSLGCRLILNVDLRNGLNRYPLGSRAKAVAILDLLHEPLENPLNRLLKRLLDVCVALPIALFLLPPLALIVKFAQMRQSPGPLLHKAIRNGFRYLPFQCLKFRTMHVNHGDENRQARRQDERVYPFGRWLRQTSLDELPQFLNVLAGHMSVVGPRPHLPTHDREFGRHVSFYPFRYFIRPGITGLAQVHGRRGEVLCRQDVVKRVNADVSYLQNWSLWLDLSIILRTALLVVRTHSKAY